MKRLFGMVATRASLDYTKVALQTFFATTKLTADDAFILIDNDMDEQLLEAISSIRGIQLVRREEPASFAANGNLLIRAAHQREADLIFLNNDIYFTPEWCEPLCDAQPAIVASNGNQNISTTVNGFELKPTMTLDDLRGYERVFQAIAEKVRTEKKNYIPAFKTNFFSVRLPKEVYRRVGLFDETFGMAGGEDDDYCVRAHLAGVPVLVAQHSFLLHFAGRSTWSGPESKEEWGEREKGFISRFEDKWGALLTNFLLRKDGSIIENDDNLKRVAQSLGARGVVVELLKRDGRIQEKSDSNSSPVRRESSGIRRRARARN